MKFPKEIKSIVNYYLIKSIINYYLRDEGLDEDRVESDNETAQAKRLRLAKQYIEQLEKEGYMIVH